jgi:hypothetical protein
MEDSGSVQDGNHASSAWIKTRQIPETEYIRRLNRREQQLAGIRALHRRLWGYLIVAILAGLAIAYVAHSSRPSFPPWVGLPSVCALFIFQALTKNARRHSRIQRIVSFYDLGLARLRWHWQGRGIGGEEFRPDEHPYASDLDLFGTGSVFELLCTARTGVGRSKLAHWLLQAGEYGEVSERQLAISELRGRLELREDWASAGGDALEQSDSSAIRAWADAPGIEFRPFERTLASTLPMCFIALSILGFAGFLGHHWALMIGGQVVLSGLLAVFSLKKTRSVTANLAMPSSELALMAPLLSRIEIERFQCTLLKSLQAQLMGPSGKASEQIRKLSSLAWLLDLRRFEHFAAIAAFVLLGTNLAILIERWRQRNSVRLTAWLDSIGQIEALLCLARYSYENPDYTFPILKTQSAALFQAEGLGHPLLDSGCVRCDISLTQGTPLIMVSGSNMSGKSTLLRSVGVNAVLANAGAPVRATRLVISPFQVGCSISVHDSLSQAKSRFQAEVERLKRILDLSAGGKVLFLLDEVLGGTNSHDRYLGARAVVERLMRSGAVGFITTHDLSLTEIVRNLGDRAINVHFEEHYEEGEMRFDYRMRAGVLPRSNGLHVMAALGILDRSESD